MVGVGCRRKKEAALIKQTICERLAQSGIAKEAVYQITSIDRKKDEPGLIETAADFNVEFVTFTENELRQVPGNFSSSAFVEKTVGVDNVCERSAMAEEPNGKLLSRKYAKDGVTVAIAMRAFFPVFKDMIPGSKAPKAVRACTKGFELSQLSHHVACHLASINLLHLRHLICTLLIRIRTARAKWTAAWRINRAWQFSFKHNTLS